MIDWLFLLFVTMGLVFMFMIIFLHKSMGFYWTSTLSLLAIILFFICSTGVMDLETPYQYWNTSTTSVETGYHRLILVENVYFSYIFYALIILIAVNWIAYIFEYMGTKKYMRQ